MKYQVLYIIVFSISLLSCSHGEIQVENNLSGHILKNIEWGTFPINDKLDPGDYSAKRRIDNNDYYDISLPSAYSLRFYMESGKDTLYCETEEKYALEHDKFILITIDDNTDLIILDNHPVY